jgi:GH15 family glucan-1,4-alpha-glucosidase
MSSISRRSDGYLPINGYGLIGDCRSAALVGTDGSIDWMCLPRFDDDPIFARILDAKKGGYWQIAPAGEYTVAQGYRDRTNVLRTTFFTPTGVVNVTDFMPIREQDVRKPARLHNIPRLVRIVECLTGEVTLKSVVHLTSHYGTKKLGLEATKTELHAEHESMHLCLQSTVPLRGRSTTLKLAAGDIVAFGLRSSNAGVCRPGKWSVERARELYATTREYWWSWVAGVRYDGPYEQHVWRSALALKLMTYAPTGAIIAAPTTSLPELIGSYHNYDYRFTWLRDAAFTLYAFFQLGLHDEANGFFDWLTALALGNPKTPIYNLYSVDGSSDVGERTIEKLDGYRGSRPVRVGNAAVDQVQLDVYGEVLDSAYVFARFGGRISKALWAELSRIVDLACQRWREPDASIWEGRDNNQQFTYSKIMCWTAIDRGLRIAKRFNFPHPQKEWAAARRAVHREVTTRGWSNKQKAFTQTLDGDALDAALLRMGQVRFLPDRDPRLRQTINAIHEQLGDGVLLRRFRRATDDFGRKRYEGSFLLCSFWLVDALAHIGDLDGAERTFEQLVSFASPLGLFAEETDPVNGEALGNFPQAFTHLALVGAAVNIERARNRTLGVRGLHARR